MDVWDVKTCGKTKVCQRIKDFQLRMLAGQGQGKCLDPRSAQPRWRKQSILPKWKKHLIIYDIQHHRSTHICRKVCSPQHKSSHFLSLFSLHLSSVWWRRVSLPQCWPLSRAAPGGQGDCPVRQLAHRAERSAPADGRGRNHWGLPRRTVGDGGRSFVWGRRELKGVEEGRMDSENFEMWMMC